MCETVFRTEKRRQSEHYGGISKIELDYETAPSVRTRTMNYALIHHILREDKEDKSQYEISLFKTYDEAYQKMARDYRSLCKKDSVDYECLEVLYTHSHMLKPHFQKYEVMLYNVEDFFLDKWYRWADTFYIVPANSTSFVFKDVRSTYWMAKEVHAFVYLPDEERTPAGSYLYRKDH